MSKVCKVGEKEKLAVMMQKRMCNLENFPLSTSCSATLGGCCFEFPNAFSLSEWDGEKFLITFLFVFHIHTVKVYIWQLLDLEVKFKPWRECFATFDLFAFSHLREASCLTTTFHIYLLSSQLWRCCCLNRFMFIFSSLSTRHMIHSNEKFCRFGFVWATDVVVGRLSCKPWGLTSRMTRSLKGGEKSSSSWCRRGTALFSLAYKNNSDLDLISFVGDYIFLSSPMALAFMSIALVYTYIHEPTLYFCFAWAYHASRQILAKYSKREREKKFLKIPTRKKKKIK